MLACNGRYWKLMPNPLDSKIAIPALVAFATWLYVVLPLFYHDGLPGEFIGVKYGEWLMFGATVALVAATWMLVRGADRNAERQLRAYVLVERAQVFSATADRKIVLRDKDASHGGEPMEIQVGYQPTANITYKNFGRTPAHDVEFFANVKIVAWPIRQEDLPGLDLGTGSREIIGPGGTRLKQEFFEQHHPITPQEWNDLTNGTLALVFFGEIRYVDAFDKNRVTRYRVFCGGEMGLRGFQLSTHDEGNTYT
jgi:hypothetical protein